MRYAGCEATRSEGWQLLQVVAHVQGLREGVSGGTSYPSLGLGGPGRVEVAALSFGPNLSEEPKLSEDLFFWSSPKFGQKVGSNLSEDLFFLVFT